MGPGQWQASGYARFASQLASFASSSATRSRSGVTACTEADKPLNLVSVSVSVSVPAPKHPVYSTNALAAVGRIIDAGRGVLAACGPNMWYCGYMDWHVGNGVVVPILGDENDERALGVIREHFPGRDVIGFDCRTIMEGGGGFHCVTKPQAAVPV